MLRTIANSIACVSKLPDAIREREAAALRALYDQRAQGVPHGKFGKEHRIGTAGQVWQYLTGHRPLNILAATKFAVGLQATIDEFSPRLAHEVRTAAAVVLPEAVYPADPRLNVVDGDLMNRAPAADRHMWVAVTLNTLQRNASLYAEEELARYHVALNALDQNGTSKLNN